MLKHVLHAIKTAAARVAGTAESKKTQGKERSPKWEAFRKAWLKENPKCAACGGTKKVQVHHIQPFHLHPERELDKKNVITLCEVKKPGFIKKLFLRKKWMSEDPGNHHLWIGHRGDFKNENPDIMKDLEAYHALLKEHGKLAAIDG